MEARPRPSDGINCCTQLDRRGALHLRVEASDLRADNFQAPCPLADMLCGLPPPAAVYNRDGLGHNRALLQGLAPHPLTMCFLLHPQSAVLWLCVQR